MPKALIVDDEALVALSLEEMLREAGFEIAGSVGSLEKALATLEACPCDVAVLDVNLRGRSTEPVAAALRRRGTPFVVVSGYGRAQLSGQFGDAPLLSKPFQSDDLIRAIRQILP
jgi:CheY-like chemotaxis protein